MNVQIHTLRGDSPPSRNSYHSSGSGSSSLGSLERLDESGYASQVNVSEMVLNGIPVIRRSGPQHNIRLICQLNALQDAEVIVAWLQDLRYEEYIPLFLNAGYDLPTIARMTPEVKLAILRLTIDKLNEVFLQILGSHCYRDHQAGPQEAFDQ